jgi:spoIIIJ-associated protein
MERENAIRFAKKYLEDLLSFYGLNTDVNSSATDDVVELHIPSTHMNAFLIGQNGDTLRALQFMVSSALKNGSYELYRVNVDVADYKKQRAERLAERAQDWLKRVKESGAPMDLEPMNSADRRIIHKIAEENGLETISVGEGRERHVLLRCPEPSEAPAA